MIRPYLTTTKSSFTWLRGVAAMGLALGALLLGAGPVAAATLFYIQGGGDGHGIGMSQYGAYGYAQHGKDYRWILGHYYTGTSIGTTNPNRTIRVLLATGSAAFGGATRAPGKRLNPSLTYSVRALATGGLALVNPAGKTVGRFAAPLTVSGNGALSLAGLGEYRGTLQFRPDGAGGVETVNALDLEDYVRGVISAEMPSGWSAAALQVQAVAARTYAITTNVGGGSFDVYRDTRSQMYGGMSAETASTDAAVAATRGQIVTYHGAPAVTYFFASSGGYTESIQDAWPGSSPQPWLKGVPDPYDNAGADPYHHWTYTLTMSAAAARLGRLLKGQLVGIQTNRDGADPRMVSAVIIGTGGRTPVSAGQIEGAFGLLSTNVAFTTITTGSGPASPTHATRAAAPPGPDGAVTALVPLVDNLVASTMPAIHGSVVPAGAGDRAEVQVSGPGGWKTVASTPLGTGGAYSVQLPGAGTYRVLYAGVAGPSVTVS